MKNFTVFFEVLGNRIEPQYGLEDLKSSVELVGKIGFDSLFESRQELINFGVKHELVSRKEVGRLNNQYIKKSIPQLIESLGIDNLGPNNQKRLKYGLDKNIFTQADIKKSQEAYRIKHAKNMFFLIKDHGLGMFSEKGKKSLQYGLYKKTLYTRRY
jgi:hypothetical protein